MPDTQALVVMWVQLGLDPGASELRGAIERTLQGLLERVDAGDGTTVSFAVSIIGGVFFSW